MESRRRRGAQWNQPEALDRIETSLDGIDRENRSRRSIEESIGRNHRYDESSMDFRSIAQWNRLEAIDSDTSFSDEKMGSIASCRTAYSTIDVLTLVFEIAAVFARSKGFTYWIELIGMTDQMESRPKD